VLSNFKHFLLKTKMVLYTFVVWVLQYKAYLRRGLARSLSPFNFFLKRADTLPRVTMAIGNCSPRDYPSFTIKCWTSLVPGCLARRILTQINHLNLILKMMTQSPSWLASFNQNFIYSDLTVDPIESFRVFFPR